MRDTVFLRWEPFTPHRARYRRAILLGFLAGAGIGLLAFSPARHTSSFVVDASDLGIEREPSSVGAWQPAHALPSHSLVSHGRALTPAKSQSLPRPSPAPVAICVGGWLELATPQRGASIREHVLKVIPSDVFVAGTLRGNATARRVTDALEGISALAPFAATSVIRMPQPSELRAELKKSGHWEDFKIQASKGGSGRFNWQDPAHDDPRLWVPIMMSPALGNPNGNTLQEFHYQSRCIEMINEHERVGGPRRRAGTVYERVMFTRLEFEWLADHPPLPLLDPGWVWVPTGEDNTGVNDRHWLANRRDAEGVFRRWDALVSGLFHQIFFATSRVRPAFMSSETYNKLHLQYRRAGVARFPNVALLHCCETSYAAGSNAARKGARCFAKGCHRSPCPRIALPTLSCSREGDALAVSGQISHKYADEGHSAVVHATALALPGARLELAQDATPKRLHIVLPPSALRAARSDSVLQGNETESLFYTCKTCEGGPDVPDPVSINVTDCLFRKHVYGHPTLDTARGKHPCRYFDDGALAAICALLGPHDIRMSLYGWFCGDVEAQSQQLWSRHNIAAAS